jgi:hypothetical protein
MATLRKKKKEKRKKKKEKSSTTVDMIWCSSHLIHLIAV